MAHTNAGISKRRGLGINRGTSTVLYGQHIGGSRGADTGELEDAVVRSSAGDGAERTISGDISAVGQSLDVSSGRTSRDARAGTGGGVAALELIVHVNEQNLDTIEGSIVEEHSVLDEAAAGGLVRQSDGAALDALDVRGIDEDDLGLAILVEGHGSAVEVDVLVAVIALDVGGSTNNGDLGDLTGGGAGGVGHERALGVLSLNGRSIAGSSVGRGQLDLFGAVPDLEGDVPFLVSVLERITGAGDVAVAGGSLGVAESSVVEENGDDDGSHTIDGLGQQNGVIAPVGHGLEGLAVDDLGLIIGASSSAVGGLDQIDDSIVSDQVGADLGIGLVVSGVRRSSRAEGGLAGQVLLSEDIVASNSGGAGILDGLQLIHAVLVDGVGVQALAGDGLNEIAVDSGDTGALIRNINAGSLDDLVGAVSHQDADLGALVGAENSSLSIAGILAGLNISNVDNALERSSVNDGAADDEAVVNSDLDLVADAQVRIADNGGVNAVPGAADADLAGLDGVDGTGDDLSLGDHRSVVLGVGLGGNDGIVILGNAVIDVGLGELVNDVAVGDGGGADEGDLREAHGINDRAVDLVVVIKVDESDGVGLGGRSLKRVELSGGSNGSVDIEVVAADGVRGTLELVLNVTDLHGLVVSLDGGQLVNNGGNNDLAVGGIDAVNRIASLRIVLVNDLDLLTEQLAVVIGGLHNNAAGQSVVIGSDRIAAKGAVAMTIGIGLLVAVVLGLGQVGILDLALEGFAEQSLVLALIIAIGDLAVGDADGGGLLDHLRVDRVVDHLSGLVTGEHLGAGDGQVVEELAQLSIADDVDRPVAADVALNGGVVAEGHAEHLGSLNGGDVRVGSEGAVATTGDDALAVAILDEAFCPVAVDVLEVGSGADERSGVNVAEHDDGDHLRHLRTGDVAGGVEGPIGHTIDDAEGVHHFNSFGVVDLVGITESCVADGDEGHGHDQRQHQSE